MVHDNQYGPETSYEKQMHNRTQMLYAEKLRERQVFMEDLKFLRKQKDKRLIKAIKESIGPKWYQALSVPQRQALDILETSIYQDLLEGRPIRTARIMTVLGIFPRPNTIDLMNCVYLGRDDAKEMLAQLFLVTYEHSIDGKQTAYCLNARLILSAIFYLGLENLIYLLRERFKPDTKEEQPKPKPKPKIEPPLKSPYLQKMVAFLNERPIKKRPRPPPLPNLDDLNEPYEEDPPLTKPPPPPPPPPPPKKRLPRAYCDKLAGIMPIEPHSSAKALALGPSTAAGHKRMRDTRLCLSDAKKTYGLGLMFKKKGGRRKKPKAPTTGLSNSNYLISGVYTIHGKTVFALGSVSFLPPDGNLIHGGHRLLGSEYINVHCGFTAHPPPPKPDPCDCLKKWTDTVVEYVKGTKCYCGHRFDYKNEGTFPQDEVPYFEKATRHAPLVFNYQTIYNMDPKSNLIEKEFKRLWDTDSMLRVDDGTNKIKDKKKKKKKSSTTCLGQEPKSEDYLKCALRLMRRVNIAARLPDIHLVPELKDWMRRRLYGPYTRLEKSKMQHKSNIYWKTLETFGRKGFGHINPPKDPLYTGNTNWVHKQDLNNKFKNFTQRYIVDIFRSQAYLTNLLWPTMCQAQFPDKKFREIYFSYLFSRIEDLQLMHPFSIREVMERQRLMSKKRYSCMTADSEPQIE